TERVVVDVVAARSCGGCGVEEIMTMRWRWCYDDDNDDVMMVAVGVVSWGYDGRGGVAGGWPDVAGGRHKWER
ncbi:hypothetical protein Tco_1063440, partial [Tanacetum coccineum]